MARPTDERLAALLARVRLLALDVDGVLTDGRVTYAGAEEAPSFSAHDGLGIRALQQEGVRVAWISGRGCAATRIRAAELGVSELHLSAGASGEGKGEVLAAVQRRLAVAPEETAAMGDDLPDLALAGRSALFAAPANARPEVRERAQIVTAARGGEGAVRELAEAILRARGRWQALLDAHAR